MKQIFLTIVVLLLAVYGYNCYGINKGITKTPHEVHKNTLEQNKSTESADSTVESLKKEQQILLLQYEKQAIMASRKTLLIFIIALLIIGSVLIIFYYYRDRKNNYLLAREKEIEQLKSRFFANISHELKTPLTFVLGPLNELLSNADDKSKGKLLLAQRNAQRLLSLVNQMLDLSKIEAGKLNLLTTFEDIIPIVKDITFSFQPQAIKKKIKLQFDTELPNCKLYIDEEKLDRTISNILNNAFKHTGTEGTIAVNVTKGIENQKQVLQIEISDTGSGIHKDDLPSIFSKYYQAKYSKNFNDNNGSGIGLSLVKEYVEMHGGKINVKSKLGLGSKFTITLPLGKEHLREDQIISEPASKTHISNVSSDDEIQQHAPQNQINNKTEILIIDDNETIRRYLFKILSNTYFIREAEDGITGVNMALTHSPDLIISDIMMPGIDGYELCKKIKNESSTSHIPIILLSAKSSDSDRLEGIESDADAFISKPFNPLELKALISNLLKNRQRTVEHQSGSGNLLKTRAIETKSKDNVFLEKLNSIIDAHLADEHFGVEELSEEIGMSRSNLHRKLKSLTKIGPNQFIRDYKLNVALRLLKADSGTVSEISFQVGFGSPSYFTKCFNDKFGYPPTDMKNQISFEI